MIIEEVWVGNIPTKVISWGDWSPSNIVSGTGKPDNIILMLPGNPGVVEFYIEFLEKLYENIQTPIWIISHSGHALFKNKTMKAPSLKKHPELYTLEAQVEHKVQFISKYLANVNITFIGHSIGCKMISEILTQNKNISVQRCYFLFPTLERMAGTPNGKRLIFSINYYITWLAVMGSVLFCFFPRMFKIFLIKIYNWFCNVDSSNEEAIMNLIHPKILSNIFYLAKDEMDVVVNLNETFVSKFQDKLYLHYGASDGWTPLYMPTELKEKFSDLDVVVCSNGYPHAFVLAHSTSFANFLSRIMLEHKSKDGQKI